MTRSKLFNHGIHGILLLLPHFISGKSSIRMDVPIIICNRHLFEFLFFLFPNRSHSNHEQNYFSHCSTSTNEMRRETCRKMEQITLWNFDNIKNNTVIKSWNSFQRIFCIRFPAQSEREREISMGFLLSSWCVREKVFRTKQFILRLKMVFFHFSFFVSILAPTFAFPSVTCPDSRHYAKRIMRTREYGLTA